MHRRVVYAAWIVASLAGPVSVTAQALTVVVSPDRVAVEGARHGEEVVLLGGDRSQLQDGSFRYLQVVDAEIDDDLDGVVEFPQPLERSLVSAWIAIEAGTGRFGAKSTFPERLPEFGPPLGLEPGFGRLAADGHAVLAILLARPGVGAWFAMAVDGGTADGGGPADRRVALLAPEWRRVAGALDDPAEPLPSDLVLALDPTSLAVDASRFGALAPLSRRGGDEEVEP